VVQADESSSWKLRRRVARRDDDRDDLNAGECPDTAKVVEAREVNRHSLSMSASGRKSNTKSEVKAKARSSDTVDLKRNVAVNRVVSDKSYENDSDVGACSREWLRGKLKSAYVSNKVGNVKPALCAKGNSNDRVSAVTKRVSSGKACVNRL